MIVFKIDKKDIDNFEVNLSGIDYEDKNLIGFVLKISLGELEIVNLPIVISLNDKGKNKSE